MKWFLRIFIVAAVVGLCYGAWAFYLRRGESTSVSYRTAAVKHGELLATIGASGTLEPEEVVDVGAQVQGRILSLGDDPDNPGHTVDYNSKVQEGQILANIDAALYDADLKAKDAAIESAKASVTRA